MVTTTIWLDNSASHTAYTQIKKQKCKQENSKSCKNAKVITGEIYNLGVYVCIYK